MSRRERPLVLGVILARGGSKGIPNKNLTLLRGRPLISYTIEAARAANRLDRLVVSTDSKEIAAVAQAAGIQVIERPPELATDKAPIEWALRHALKAVEAEAGAPMEVVVTLYGNVPVRKEGIIDLAVAELLATGADSVQSYAPCEKPPQWAFRLDGGRVSLLDDRYEGIYRRQDLEPAFYVDGAVLVVSRASLMDSETSTRGHAFLGRDRRAIVGERMDTVDVDTPADLLWAEFVLAKLGGGGVPGR